ncbi:MAG: immunoglobulin domain-containing protein [Verrucomicrobiota bacterium]|jgi:hypothetical protein
MKRCFLLSLLALVAAAVARGQPATFYVNDSVVIAPPEIPPQVDALNFVNNNYFSVTFTNLVIDVMTLTVNSVLFQPVDTLNFTNRGYMSVDPGINFLTVPAQAGQPHMAANFFNPGTIHVGSDTNLVLVGANALFWGGLPQMVVQATNVFNPGSISVGYDGLCSLQGQNVDLSRGALMMTNSGTSIYNSVNGISLLTGIFLNGGIFDGYWGMGTDLFNPYFEFIQPPPRTPPHVVTTRDYNMFVQELVLAPDGLSYLDDIYLGPSNRLVRALFLNNTNAAFAPKVYFTPLSEIGLEWSLVVTNDDAATQLLYFYIFDEFPNFITVPFLALDGFAGVGITRPTFIPDNYLIFEDTQPQGFLGPPVGPVSIPPFTFPFASSTNLWTAYEALLPPISVILSDVAGQDVTNIPGRIEISAEQAMDLSLAKIKSLNYLSLAATNQFLGSSQARIAAPFADINLRSTNGWLDITNLLKPSVEQPEGYVDLWSTCITNVDANFITNVYDVMFADAHLAPFVPTRVQSLALCSTNTLGGPDNLVIHDVFHVTRNLRLETSRLTIATNDLGSPTATGALFLDSSSILWPNATPRLQYLTNYGAIQTYNSVFFGGSRSSPFYNSNYNEPYLAFVNRGTVTNNGSLIWAADFEDSGVFSAAIGDIQLQQARNAILTNGLLLAANGSLALNSGYLLVSNTLFVAGGNLGLCVTNALTDGIANLAVVDPTNLLTMQVITNNVWRVGNGGLSLLVKPAAGDLLGTSITNTATFNTKVPILWSAADLGCSSEGFLNNAALGRLVLVGSPDSLFAFTGGGPHSALYVDYLEFQGFTATNTNPLGDFTGIEISPNIMVYYAQAVANGIPIAEKLNGRNGGRFCWVSNYNYGYFSSTNRTYPDGTTYRLNAALVASCDLVSNTTNTPPVVNCLNPVPIWPISPPPAPTNDVPLLAAITVPPQGQTVLQGGSATFSVLASSAAPLSYQWRHNGTPIPGATASACTIDDVQPASAGAYSVVVSSFVGDVISADAPLTVNLPPAISGQPQDLTLAPGDTAAFSVRALGDPPLSYQWSFNGTPIAGATASGYAKANVQAVDAGQYLVMISNPFGSVTSAGAALHVLPTNPPRPGTTLALTPPPLTLSAQKPSANAFAPALGTYNGLFSDTNGAAAASSGYFSAKVTRGGAYSAKLILGGRSYSTSGAFSPVSSLAAANINRGSRLAPLTLTLRLDLSGGGQMLGTVAAGANWSAALQAYRSAPAPARAYTLVIPHAGAGLGSWPAGDGCGTLKVGAAGNVQFSGALADGTKVSQSATLSTNGYWPLYVSLYGGSGCLLSWLDFTNATALDGQLLWLKSADARTKNYPAGFTNDLTALGWLYTPAGALAGLTGGELVLRAGGLTDSHTNTFGLDARRRVVRPAGSRLSLSFTTSSGLFSGSTWSPELNRTLTFQGVLSEPATNGYGYFLVGPQQSGQVYLDLAR